MRVPSVTVGRYRFAPNLWPSIAYVLVLPILLGLGYWQMERAQAKQALVERRAAGQVAAMDVPLDMLILNAGIMQLPELQLTNGVERQFAVNHVGHFLLTIRLLDQVKAAEAGRVVVVSSGAHRWAPDGMLGMTQREECAFFTVVVAGGC